MRSLTDIQVELRTLEKEMHNTLAKLAELHQDIELLKPQPKLSAHMDMKKIYSGIDAVAKKAPINHPNLGVNGSAESRAYLKLLAIMIPAESESFVQPLTYLARIARGCKHPISAEELHRVSVELDLAQLEQSISVISSDLYLPLMLDGIMMASVEGTPSSDSLALLGELGNLLNISEGDMKVVAQLAEVLLVQDSTAFFKLNPKKHYPMLGYAVPTEWLDAVCIRCHNNSSAIGSISSRYVTFSFNGNTRPPLETKFYKQNGAYVTEDEPYRCIDSRDIKAPVSGILRCRNVSQLQKACKESILDRMGSYHIPNRDSDDLFMAELETSSEEYLDEYIVSCFEPR